MFVIMGWARWSDGIVVVIGARLKSNTLMARPFTAALTSWQSRTREGGAKSVERLIDMEKNLTLTLEMLITIVAMLVFHYVALKGLVYVALRGLVVGGWGTPPLMRQPKSRNPRRLTAVTTSRVVRALGG